MGLIYRRVKKVFMTKEESISALVRAALEGNRDDVLRACKVIVESEPDGSSLTQSILRHIEEDQASRPPDNNKAYLRRAVALIYLIVIMSWALLVAISDNS